MTRPYSEDLRERALARYEAGETIRAIGEALAISPSYVSKWRKLKQETGALKPGQIGGQKKPVLSGDPGMWLAKRVRRGPFTLRGLVAELAARDEDGPAGGLGVRAGAGAELQKNAAGA